MSDGSAFDDHINSDSATRARHYVPQNTPMMASFSAAELISEQLSQVNSGKPTVMAMSSATSSDAGSFIFDNDGEHIDPEAEGTEPTNVSPEEPASYDLRAPAPSISHSNIEVLCGRLFSSDHLNLILRDHAQAHRFTTFLKTYRPNLDPALVRYLETQKALAAIQYANAIAGHLKSGGASSRSADAAAAIDPEFEKLSRAAVEELVTDALPAYITHRLVQIVTECLVKEITGGQSPIMRELVQGVAEVYCMTDATLPDNPIVFASEEFYRTTQYGKDYVIGKNCRFLQGPKTPRSSVNRLIEAIGDGTEICETILNYRRDGTPFLNLLMIAPLHDNKGRVRYFIGCQIDVSNLIEGGKGLDTFQKMLAQDRVDSRYGGNGMNNPLKSLSDLGQMLNAEETETIRHGTQARSAAASPKSTRPTTSRRYLGVEDPNDMWAAPHLGKSGRLPGVYKNYLLVRPYPSLRITFTSPALRIPGLAQSRLLDRIGGPQHIRDGIFESLSQGIGVTAKVSWLHTATNPGEKRSSLEGKPRWIHCTPMLGSDEKVGVWMIVMIEKEEITGALNSRTFDLPERAPPVADRLPESSSRSRHLESPGSRHHENSSRHLKSLRGLDSELAGSRLYAEYLMQREGRSSRPMSPHSTQYGSLSSRRGDTSLRANNGNYIGEL